MSKPYHKIDTIWKRDPSTGKIIEGLFSRDEFLYLTDYEWEWTEKIDGTNIHVIRSGEH